MQLLDDYERRRKTLDHPFFVDPQFKDLKSEIKAIITKDSFLLHHRMKGSVAVHALEGFALEFIEDNPDAKNLNL